MKKTFLSLLSAAALISLTSCSSPIQSRFNQIKSNNYALVYESENGLLDLTVNYERQGDTVYAEFGVIEIYIYKNGNSYESLTRFNTNSEWRKETLSKADYDFQIASLAPFNIEEADDSWFVETDEENEFILDQTKIPSFLIEEDAEVTNILLDTSDSSLKITMETSSVSLSYTYSNFGRINISVPTVN